MLVRLVQLGLALLVATTAVSAVAQPITQAEADRAIHSAHMLSGQIRSFHRGRSAWTGYVPPGYCRIMSAGEFTLKELARLASKAVQLGWLDLSSRLERAGDLLSDELDVEEEINDAAHMSYGVYPCPAATSSYTARASLLRLIVEASPECRKKADAQRVSFAARRAVMHQCLRLPGQP
jgi:hypothetical protein